MARGSLLLHLPVAEQAAVVEVDGQHLARAQAALFDDAALFELHHPGFRAHHHIAVAGDAVAGRPQAIAIQGGANAAAIGKHQQGRAIPGLLQTGVVLVHGLDGRTVLQFWLLAEGLRHEGEQAVRDRAAAAHQQLQGGVKVGRITKGLIHHRLEIIRGLTPNRIEVGFCCPGPVEIAQQGVDFAVVTQQAHGLGQGPAGQGIGAEAAVVHRKTHGKAPIAQVGIKPRQHFRAHHAFVDNGAAAQGGEIEVAGARAPGFPGAIANPAPQPKQQGFQRISGYGLSL